MKTSIALHINALKSILSAAVVALGLTFYTQTTHAQVAANFTIVNHANGQPLSLTNYQGSIILLDFWAYWCGPCQAAASDIEPNITKYYRSAGGNSNGVPVQVISISMDCSDMPLEDGYITDYGLELVADDCDDVAFAQFDNGYIPQFAVINGTTNSSNYGSWQILYSNYGYLTNSTVPTLKSFIEAVQTPTPLITMTNPVSGTVMAPSNNIILGAMITTNGKIIKNVAFYNGATLLGSTTNMPYSLVWSNVPAGAKSVFARAYYGASASANSEAVNFTVGEPIITRLTQQGTNLLLSWTGGTGNYQVQMETNLTDAVWQNYGTAGTNTSLLVTRSNQAAFFRVKGQ
jgi:thiol-disulfide isomerase/thioredoxin